MASASKRIVVTTNPATKNTLGERIRSYLDKSLNDLDVTFCVGPEKIKIKALRIALVASSSAMEKLFKEKWDTGVANNEEGIPIPEINPQVFEIFLKLLLADDLTCEKVISMKIPYEVVFNLIQVAKQFEMLEIEGILHSATAQFFRQLPEFVKTDEFLKLPRDILETVLSSELLNMSDSEVFKFVCKWAEANLSQTHDQTNEDLDLDSGPGPTGAQLREALGSALFQVRFPLMTFSTFAKTVCPKNILSDAEELQIFKFIAIHQGSHDSNRFDAPNIPFNTRRRKHEMASGSNSEVAAFNDIRLSDGSSVLDIAMHEERSSLKQQWEAEESIKQCLGLQPPINYKVDKNPWRLDLEVAKSDNKKGLAEKERKQLEHKSHKFTSSKQGRALREQCALDWIQRSSQY